MPTIYDTPNAQAWMRLLAERLTEKRLAHVISVTQYIMTVAESAGVDRDAAVQAGLLHDLCRCMGKSALLDAANRYGIAISTVQWERPVLLHGPVAAMEAKHELGVRDEALLDAVYWHTTGRPELGRLGQALYFADFAEPLRRHEEAGIARARLEADGFDSALRYAVEAKLFYVKKRPEQDPQSLAFRDWLLSVGPV